MDLSRLLALLIPILALSIPVSAILVGGLVKLARIRHEGSGTPELLNQLDDLRDELHQLRDEMADVQERLDFTERMLASRPPKELPPAS